MNKKIKIISIILGVVMITGITSVTVLRLNSISPIEQECIDEYGDIAEMYYNAFDFPDKKHKNSKLLRQNGFKKRDTNADEFSKVVKYRKKEIINDKNCDFSVEFIYDTKKHDDFNHNNIMLELSYEYQDTDFTITKNFNGYTYRSKVEIGESTDSGYHTVSISLLNDELIYEEEDADKYLYDNYLNGEYDDEIGEMLSIMDESLK